MAKPTRSAATPFNWTVNEAGVDVRLSVVDETGCSSLTDAIVLLGSPSPTMS